jgi:catechol 2,3-dioxygenase-like lactoylglutathione lyase family enzyme
MNSPVLAQIGTVFMPVSDIEAARDWYCDLLGKEADGEVQFGHIYVIPLEGTNLVLDSKIYSEEKIVQIPLFHFNTENIEDAYLYMKQKGIDVINEIQHGHYFNFRDPDGNTLMICKC